MCSFWILKNPGAFLRCRSQLSVNISSILMSPPENSYLASFRVLRICTMFQQIVGNRVEWVVVLRVVNIFKMLCKCVSNITRICKCVTSELYRYLALDQLPEESNVAFRSFVHVLEDFGHELVVCRLKLIPKICSSTLVVFIRFMTHSTGPSFAYPHSAFLTYWRLKSWKCLTSSVYSVFKYSLYFEIGIVVDASSCNIKWRSEKKISMSQFWFVQICTLKVLFIKASVKITPNNYIQDFPKGSVLIKMAE